MDKDAAELKVEHILKRLEGIPIAADGDLFINLYTTRYVGNGTFPSALNNKPIEGKILSTVKVRRQVLAENFDFFKSMLSRNQFGERSQGTIDIHCDYPLAAQLWFRLYHDSPLPEVFSETPVEEVWNVIHWGGYIQAQHNSDQIDLSKLRPWFDKVLERYDPEKMDIDTTRMFLFPCYAFDHAEGFAEITRRLAYEMASHIQEKNPSSYFHGHLDHHIIGALNAARGSLRGNLIRGLFDPVSSFLNADCECKEKSLFSYCEALRGTEIWPLHDQHKKSINCVIQSSGFVRFQCEIPENACTECVQRLQGSAVQHVGYEIAYFFDGLCLDCINQTSKDDYKDIDRDYWTHASRGDYDYGCRISHEQPTWYFSYMGRRSVVKKFMAANGGNYNGENGFSFRIQ